RGLLLAGLFFAGGAARAVAEPPSRPKPKRPSETSVAADAALAAFKANDSKALEALSRATATDPWAIATVLLERGESKAAAALAAAAPRPDTKSLPGYVARFTVGPEALSLRGALDEAAEWRAEKKWAESLARYDALLPDV